MRKISDSPFLFGNPQSFPMKFDNIGKQFRRRDKIISLSMTQPCLTYHICISGECNHGRNISSP